MLLCWTQDSALSSPFQTLGALCHSPWRLFRPLKIWFWLKGQKVSQVSSLEMLQALLLPVIDPSWPAAPKAKTLINGHIFSKVWRIFKIIAKIRGQVTQMRRGKKKFCQHFLTHVLHQEKLIITEKGWNICLPCPTGIAKSCLEMPGCP